MTTLSIRQKLRKPLNRLFRSGGGQKPAAGVIQGLKASADEMTFAKALSRFEIPFQFSTRVFTPYTVLGEENQIDFILYLPNRTVAVEVDGEFSHKTIGQKEKDRERDAILGDVLKKIGVEPNIIRLDTKTFLRDDRTAERTVRNLFT